MVATSKVGVKVTRGNYKYLENVKCLLRFGLLTNLYLYMF